MKKFLSLFLCGGILFSCSNKEKISNSDVDTHNAALVKDAVIEQDAYRLYEDLQSSLVKNKKFECIIS